MKKLFLSLAVVCSVALISCGGNKAEKEEANDQETMEQTDATNATNEVAAVGVEMRDSITPNGDTIQVPVQAVIEEVTETATPAPEENK